MATVNMKKKREKRGNNRNTVKDDSLSTGRVCLFSCCSSRGGAPEWGLLEGYSCSSTAPSSGYSCLLLFGAPRFELVAACVVQQESGCSCLPRQLFSFFSSRRFLVAASTAVYESMKDGENPFSIWCLTKQPLLTHVSVVLPLRRCAENSVYVWATQIKQKPLQ